MDGVDLALCRVVGGHLFPPFSFEMLRCPQTGQVAPTLHKPTQHPLKPLRRNLSS